MSEISDELRAAGNRLFLRGSDGYGTIMSLADRIDDEMVELPRDANDETIHLGDKTYDLNGDNQTAVSFLLLGVLDPTWMVNCPSGYVAPRNLTHKRQDSLERIADEIEGAKETCFGEAVFSGIAQHNIDDWANRIRKIAKEREHES